MIKNVHIRYEDKPLPPDPDLGFEGDDGEFWEVWVDLPALPRVGDWMQVGAPGGGVLGHGYVQAVKWRVDLAEGKGEDAIDITVDLSMRS